MATIVTVHGTFASGEETGQKWWQKGSPFEGELRKHVEANTGNLTWQPVIWDGQNSETSRREAGVELYKAMASLEEAGEPYSVIGHSHGGSVISAALMEAARRKRPLENLASWLTIGTPFIQTEKERFLFSRLGLFGKAIYVALLTGFLVFLITFGAAFIGQFSVSPEERAYGPVITVLFFALLLAIFIVPFFGFYLLMKWFTDRKLHIYNKRTARFAADRFHPRWFSLWHVNDEAVQGLGSLKSLKLDVFAKDFAVNPINLLAVFLVPLFLLVVLPYPSISKYLHQAAVSQGYKGVFMRPLHPIDYDCGDRVDRLTADQRLKLPCDGDSYLWNLAFLTDASIVFTYIKPFRPQLIENDDRVSIPEAVFCVLVFSGVLLLVALVLTYLVQVLARAISGALSRKLNPLTTSQIRSMALGSDTPMDNAVHATSWPMWLGAGHPPLPGALGDPIQAESDSAVSKVVPKFRDALGTYGAATTQQEKSDILTEYLTWDELIHTSYFKNEQFAKLVAFTLASTNAFQATQSFQRDADYNTVAQWFTQIRNTAA